MSHLQPDSLVPPRIQCVNLGTVKIVSDSQQHIINLLYKDGQHVSSLKVKPKHLNHPQVTGCSIGHNPSIFNFSESTPQILCFLPKMVSVILDPFHHADVCSSV